MKSQILTRMTDASEKLPIWQALSVVQETNCVGEDWICVSHVDDYKYVICKDVTPCSAIEVHERFERMHYLQFQVRRGNQTINQQAE